MAYGGIPYGGADSAVETPASSSFLMRGFGGDTPYFFGVGGDR